MGQLNNREPRRRWEATHRHPPRASCPPCSRPRPPIAHLVVADAICRAAITETLARRGWSVVPHPTGLHLIQAISDLILDEQPVRYPDLIVADAAARGCSGLTIARGLRELGAEIPIVVIARTVDGLVPDGRVTIVTPDDAVRAVERIASRRDERSDMAPSRPPPRCDEASW